MKKSFFALLFITVFLGCQHLIKDVPQNDNPLTKTPESLSIGTNKESLRKWEKEIGSDTIDKTIAEKNKTKSKEKVPSEFIFPASVNEVGSDLKPINYEGEMVDMDFNFKNAEIRDVVYQLFGKILKLNYILDKRVAGTITLNTTGKIHKEDLFAIAQSILSLNGYAVVKDGELYVVVPLQDVRQMPGTVYKGDKIVKRGKDIITQIIPLKYIPPQELIPTLRTFLTQGGTAVSPNDTDVIVVIDDASNMERLITIIKTFDVPFLAGKALKFYDVKNLNAKDLARDLETIASTLGAITKGKKANLAFLPFFEAGKLLVATQTPEFFNTVDLWIKNLDVALAEGEVIRTYIYKMQHILAETVAPILNEIFKTEIEENQRNLQTQKIAKKELKIIPTAATNSLIIKATQSDYNRIKGIIDELDSTPQQVLIEVVIAEVNLKNDLKYGVQYFLRDRFKIGPDGSTDTGGLPESNPQRQLEVDLFETGTDSLVFMTESIGFDLIFSALATQGEFEFLSTPNILVRDDQTATIQVGEDTPIIGNSTVTGVGTVQNSVQYRSVGIILSVTPHIGENGFVTLDITTEDSEVGAIGAGGSPAFTTRRAETSLVVKDGHTIIIGGIIETRDNKNVKKVPLLGDIPVLGNLFKSKEISKDKTELMLVITPYVIDTIDEADVFTKRFKERLKTFNFTKESSKGS